MTWILLIIIALQFGYIIFKDIKSEQEREGMLLKLMSKDVKEYRDVVEEPVKDSPKQEPDVHVPIESVPFETILKGMQ